MVQIVFDAGATEQETEFGLMTVLQGGMVQILWGQDGTCGKPEVQRQVGGTRFVKERGMPDGITTVLVPPRVETGEIIVPDIFFALNMMVECDGRV